MAVNSNSNDNHLITLENINANVVRLEYAVRGPLPIRATQLQSELASGVKKPFNEVIRANIGDCQAMKQTPITFIRQVLAAATLPSLLDGDFIPNDVKERVRLLLKYCGGGSVGAYSDSAGIEIIRRHVAEYITERDGIRSDWQNVVLTTGASDAARFAI